MDSGSSRHLFEDKSLLQDPFICDDRDGRKLPNNKTLQVTKFGKVAFRTLVDDEIHEVTLSDVYYASSLSKDLRLISYVRLKNWLPLLSTVLLMVAELKRTVKLCLNFGWFKTYIWSVHYGTTGSL